MKNRFAIKTIVFILIVCVVAIVAIWLHYKKELKSVDDHYKELLSNMTTSEEPATKKSILETETTISTDIIKEKLKDIGFLCTEEYYFTQVAQYKSTKKDFFNFFSIPLTQSHFICSYDGLITAGIDFESIVVEKNDENKTITISVPQATIKSTEIFEDSYKVFDEKESIFNPISTNDDNNVRKKMKQNAIQKAKDNNVLEKADDNAKNTIEQFVAVLIGSDEYKIEVKQLKDE